jgi:hypothetical protein
MQRQGTVSVIAPVRTVCLGSIHVDSDIESRTELDSHAECDW